MSQQRQQDLRRNLDLLYEQLAMFEQELIVAYDVGKKFALKTQINREIVPSIRRYEREYWQLQPQDAIAIPEAEAEAVLLEVDREVRAIERVESDRLPPEVVELLADIRNKLDTPERAASAKLAVTLPVIPLLASYNFELDTESTLLQVWQKIRGRFTR